MITSSLKGCFRGLATVAALSAVLGLAPLASAEDVSPVPAIVAEPTNLVIPGKMVWADLLTTNVPAASRFYSVIFGWDMLPSDDPDYVTAAIDGRPVAAIASYERETPEHAEPLWLPPFSVRDVDAAMERALQSGGAEPAAAGNLPGRGRLAVLQDPQGAVVSLLRASSGDPADGGKPRAGAWLWPELWAADPAAAIAFYQGVLELEAIIETDDNGLTHHILGNDDIARATAIAMPVEGVEPNWLLYLMVHDLAATLKLALANGGEILLPPMAGQLDSVIAIIADPTGGVLALQQFGGES
jgi:predicted enzyme related to lactoylglutathione lyase